MWEQVKGSDPIGVVCWGQCAPGGLTGDVSSPRGSRWRKGVSGLQVPEAGLWREEAVSFHGQSKAKVMKATREQIQGYLQRGGQPALSRGNQTQWPKETEELFRWYTSLLSWESAITQVHSSSRHLPICTWSPGASQPAQPAGGQQRVLAGGLGPVLLSAPWKSHGNSV